MIRHHWPAYTAHLGIMLYVECECLCQFCFGLTLSVSHVITEASPIVIDCAFRRPDEILRLLIVSWWSIRVVKGSLSCHAWLPGSAPPAIHYQDLPVVQSIIHIPYVLSGSHMSNIKSLHGIISVAQIDHSVLWILSQIWFTVGSTRKYKDWQPPPDIVSYHKRNIDSRN